MKDYINDKCPRESDDDDDDEIYYPNHYHTKGIECWDWYKLAMTPEEYRGAMKANIYKYMYRAGDKDDTIKDLRKARAYLTRLIDTIEEGRDNDDYACKKDVGWHPVDGGWHLVSE